MTNQTLHRIFVNSLSEEIPLDATLRDLFDRVPPARPKVRHGLYVMVPLWGSGIILMISIGWILWLRWSGSAPSDFRVLAALTVAMALFLTHVLLDWSQGLRNTREELTEPLLLQLEADLVLISEITRDYSIEKLRYAEALLQNKAEGATYGIALLVGPIEKIGFIPLSVATSLAGLKAFHDHIISAPTTLVAVVAGTLFLFLSYVTALNTLVAAQHIRRIALMVREAIVRKELKSDSD